jgi:nitrite reductase/ring-hydroxylating ferredoxin subunit
VRRDKNSVMSAEDDDRAHAGEPCADRKPCTAPGECAPHALGRRKFLTIAGSTAGAALVAGAVPGCTPGGQLAAGNISALPVGTLLVMDSIAIARDADGVYAMTTVCTHQGCQVQDAMQTIAAGLHCFCHGSRYDGNGVVTNGPATRDLQHYAVTVAADGSLTVDTGKSVAATTRTAVL